MPTARSIRDARYNAKSSKHYGMKLNVRTDADLIARLDSVASVNGYLRRLIREDIERNPQLPDDDRKPFEPCEEGSL